ncbi:hypothetical protein AK812_SmicGene26744 [Symbiodinium microadriaticum]|uniref:Uncharacterized protein n=1 Tax=Symbiodinium microadriaticum TaxID=2951 RepID=A0A1Q9D8N4_SYMMI|nr:hypothetical protein AK812_SmicGene26744 [Symbiodinium microadriaticum]
MSVVDSTGLSDSDLSDGILGTSSTESTQPRPATQELLAADRKEVTPIPLCPQHRGGTFLRLQERTKTWQKHFDLQETSQEPTTVPVSSVEQPPPEIAPAWLEESAGREQAAQQVEQERWRSQGVEAPLATWVMATLSSNYVFRLLQSMPEAEKSKLVLPFLGQPL